MRQVLPGRRRKGKDQTSDPVGAEQDKDPVLGKAPPRVSRFIWLWLAISIVLGMSAQPGPLAVAVIGLLGLFMAYRYEKICHVQHAALRIQAEHIRELEHAQGLLVANSIDLEHFGWITPEKNLIVLERTDSGTKHRIPPTGSQPCYLLPGPESNKWAK